MIATKYKDYTIEIFDDSHYKENSTDNPHKYDIIYGDSSEFSFTSLHGIKIYDVEGNLLKCVGVANTGGATSINKNSFVIKNNLLLICCCDSIFCLSVPNLKLQWQKTADYITCFEIFKCENDYIIRGEVDIIRITDNGDILWKFSGKDIFVTQSGVNDFFIKDDFVFVKDWEENEYKIDCKTGDGNIIPRFKEQNTRNNTLKIKSFLKRIFD